MSAGTAATPSQVDIIQLTETIITHVDAALHAHGRKNFVESAEFVDIMLDIRKLAQYILDSSSTGGSS